MGDPRFVRQALKGQPLTVYGDGQQSRCFMHVMNAVQALIKLMECPTAVGQVFNIGSNEEVTILELANRVLELTYLQLNGQQGLFGYILSSEMQQEVIPLTSDGTNRIKMMTYQEAYGTSFEDMQRRVPDISKIHQLTGWTPTHSLDQIVQDIIREYAVSQVSESVSEHVRG